MLNFVVTYFVDYNFALLRDNTVNDYNKLEHIQL